MLHSNPYNSSIKSVLLSTAPRYEAEVTCPRDSPKINKDSLNSRAKFSHHAKPISLFLAFNANKIFVQITCMKGLFHFHLLLPPGIQGRFTSPELSRTSHIPSEMLSQEFHAIFLLCKLPSSQCHRQNCPNPSLFIHVSLKYKLSL